MNDEVEEVKEQKSGAKGFVFGLLPYILVLALGAAGGIYFAQQKPEVLGLSKGAQVQQAANDALVADVAKLIALPTDEKPTIATVTDASKVKDQPFFANAKNGDTVLIYTKAQKAILYRATEKRIIEVGAVNINNNQPQATVAPSPTPSPTPKPKS